MKIKFAGLTDKGMRRNNNEDSFLAESPLFVVADGVGGHLAGEVASRMAVNTIGDYMGMEGGAFIGEYDKGYSEAANKIASAIRLANKAINEAAGQNPGWKGMVTTVVAAYISGGAASIAHVGDSRAYLVRAGSIIQLTEDHSLVSEQVRGGLLTPEEARRSNIRNIVTRALGNEPSVEVDCDEVSLMDGDRLLLCTDGLSEMVEEGQILSTISSTDDPAKACSALIGAANANGGKDNVTAVLIYLYKVNLYYYLKKLFGLGRR